MPNRIRDGKTPSRKAPRGPTFTLNTPARNNDSNNYRNQFASAPRFLIPQNQNQRSVQPPKDGIERFRQRAALGPFGRASRDDSSRVPFATPTPLQRSNAVDGTTERNIKDHDLAQKSIEEENDVSDERQRDENSPFEDLFAPPDPNKRRRISRPEPVDLTDEGFPGESQSQNTISSSSENSPPSPEQGRVRYTLASPFPHHGPLKRRPPTETPAPSRRKYILEPETPSIGAFEHNSITASQTPAFRGPPRYVVSSNYTPLANSPSTPPTRTDSNLQNTKKRPAFVLPRSPSPGREQGTNADSPPPAPFSPTSTHTLTRRGRAKSSATATYLPGGMAEQVRNWILELGMKREQGNRSHYLADPSRYSFTARVDSCQNGYLNSSGPVIMVHATQVVIETNDQGAHHTITKTDIERDILLLGEPTSSRANTQPAHIQHNAPDTWPISPSRTVLSTGELIGIQLGLMWEVELNMKNEYKELTRKVIASSQSPELSDDDSDEMDKGSSEISGNVKKWQVAAEWDLLMRS
ncbi:hypothetical protein BGW36DRAFT_84129 [Talaromyces proteolyticus]|uniref:Uncharacterized protein n=1 Tax=Talaromyces proteolyticus TaxID=1131652 RepID=A0AAD4KZ14_9EURO|nr:uncharacterized protein BGW36DRAFT_84129 [Talaromyces proteolyticus]KAH8703223.1 hypothetical protein BGW36DRAFT_84129 [Talaromyces proteolyticus]